jgi:hypothetical protein
MSILRNFDIPTYKLGSNSRRKRYIVGLVIASYNTLGASFLVRGSRNVVEFSSASFKERRFIFNYLDSQKVIVVLLHRA